MIDGVSVFATEKQIAKKYKKDPDKIKAWNDLKEEALSALEQAKVASTKTPVDAEVENKLNAIQRLNDLVKECELDCNSIAEIVKDYVDNYAIMNNSQLLAQAVLDDVYVLQEEETYTVEDVERIIEEITTKRASISEHLSNVTAGKSKIDEIEAVITEINTLSQKINEICHSLNGREKDIFLAQLQGYMDIVATANDEFKNIDNIADLDVQANIILENKTKIEELLNQIVEANKELSKTEKIEKLQSLYERANTLIESLDKSDVKNRLSSVMLILNFNKRLIKDLENDVVNNVEEKEPSTLKASLIVQLIEIGVDALRVLDNSFKEHSLEIQSKIAEAIGDMSTDLRISKESTILEIRENISKAKVKYETKILPYLTITDEKGKAKTKNNSSNKNPKTTSRKSGLNKNIIVSENSIIIELEDSSSATYDYIMHLLRTSKKFKMTKEEAEKAIIDFTFEANRAHDQQMHAKDVFEKGSVGEYILRKAKLQLTKGITMQL